MLIDANNRIVMGNVKNGGDRDIALWRCVEIKARRPPAAEKERPWPA